MNSNDAITERWGYGVAAPILCGFAGLYLLITQEITIRGGVRLRAFSTETHYTGYSAVAIGFACCCLAMLLHCHFYWCEHPRYFAVGEIGKVLSLLGRIVCVFGFLVLEFARAVW